MTIPLEGLAYGDLLGLWLHCDRVDLQRAAAVARGVDAAGSSDSLSPAWFDAICPLVEQIKHVQRETNMLRRLARAQAKLGW